MILNPTDTKENPANETCEKFNQFFYEVQNKWDRSKPFPKCEY